MAALKPGDSIDYVVTYLEMTERPRAPIPPRPANLNTALLCAEDPPADYFLYLYSTVGATYEWTDWLQKPKQDVEAFVANEHVLLYTLMVDGWPGGFFMLDSSDTGTCDLAYFGLMPQAIGRGLGKWLLATAVDLGWEQPGTERMTVNTNTLDHPRALGLYQKVGFQPVRREAQTRILTRERTT
ncbi:MAG: GNAT family N-acetyltransferase [Pseudomonadota bacterium]